jgi:hypothetical protein
MDTQLVRNGTLAESSAQASGIWRVREGITEALVKRGGARRAGRDWALLTGGWARCALWSGPLGRRGVRWHEWWWWGAPHCGAMWDRGGAGCAPRPPSPEDCLAHPPALQPCTSTI